MSVNYDSYLEQHIDNVNKAAEWLCEHFPDVKEGIEAWKSGGGYIFPSHDKSKFFPTEYKPYDDYFYGEKTPAVEKAFNYAWLHHIHVNPHHWQYWVLQHDDEPEEVLEMPYEYVIEMICDWWSFSFAKGELYEIFEWYEKHQDMKLHPDTRKLVEELLGKIKEELKLTIDNNNIIVHHGIKGQRWGVRNGPPYPIKGYIDIKELSENMKTFNYKEFDRLMSADEVGKTKSGSCHDQVMYEFQQLRRLGKNPKGLFVMEYNNNNQGGMTHSLVYYEEEGNTHWFENAWTERAGDTAYRSLEDIKKEIQLAHETGEFGNRGDYANLIFGDFNESSHEIGEDLQTLVDICIETVK